MTATEVTIDLDRKHRAIRSGDRWAVQRRLPEGGYDLVAAWAGSRRSLVQWCAENGVYPSRDAERILDGLSEGGFRDR